LIPRGVAVDGAGTVYVADLQQAISKLGSDGKLAGFVGTPGKTGSSDGSGAGASFWNVFALAADAGGNLYAADNGNNLIRKITPAGAVTTVAGTRGSAELQTGSLPGSLAAVSGVAVDKSGNLFATSGNAVVKVVPGQ
jgi:sugar lactone lactonase YvrE